MRYNDRPRPAGGASGTPLLERVRAAYRAVPLRTRLIAGGAVLLAALVAGALTDIGLIFPLALVAVLLVVALMRSADAAATLLICAVWSAAAFQVFGLFGLSAANRADISVVLLMLLPLPVALVASRLRAFPAWQTTGLSLGAALVLGTAVLAATHMFLGAVAGAVAAAVAAAAVLLVRASAARQAARRQQPQRPGGRPAAAAPGGPQQTQGQPVQQRQQAPAGAAPYLPAPSGAGHDAPPPRMSVQEALAELENMIGLEPVKQQIRSIAASIEAARMRAEAGYSTEKPLRHFVFVGPPGTGKTSVARIIANIFYSFELLPTPYVVEAQRADLVGEFLGATALKTNEAVDRALGGVLFIDEAYSLVNAGDGQPDRFGNEAVQTLLKRAEDDRDNLVIVLAGYEKEMESFLGSNPGLSSRFGTRVHFPSYSPAELLQIAESRTEARGDQLDPDARPVLWRRLEEAVERGIVDELGNGRFVRSLVAQAAQARDVRVVGAGGAPTPEQLVTIRGEDVDAAYAQLTARFRGYAETPSVEEALAELDGMIGLDPVKQQVRSIVAQLQAARLRQAQGLRSHPPMRHFVFTGPPGTGKTTVARILGRVFAALGLLSRPEVVEAQRADLVGEHLGSTAVKTNKLIDSAMGGVLFVDEAYALANPGYSGGDAFGSEAIQTLLKRAEDDRSRLVIVLAGYSSEMDRFLASNAGLASRFNVRVTFPSYSPRELRAIAEHLAAAAGDRFDEAAAEDLDQIFGYVCAEGWIDELGNGRFARSLFEKACSFRDLRVTNELGEAATADDLTTVTGEDLRDAYREITRN
ncbi:AAA family ATPase [Allonocardiopsis opalescens]|uniref:Type VII secretion ATPase EccA n=1 Tax=Allonocardiopsis opalescens TaxID=1144618 RepID=A0A2T0Q0P5_9ACTN|nr:AAA family ATPase [Allonocardiopsis opalescens]PRX97360.1 type VII secretion ATPase EccA [Allonocardiopsis opalescens]